MPFGFPLLPCFGPSGFLRSIGILLLTSVTIAGCQESNRLSTQTNIPIFNEGMPVISVKTYNAKGDGTTDDTAAIKAALTAVAVTGGTLYFPAGTYAYATSPNFARAGVNVFADRATIFKHTGTGNAFTIDGGATGSGILGLRFDNITVQGNANSTNGIYVRSIHHSLFNHPQVKGCATKGAAILCEWCVLDQWNSPRVSQNEFLSPIPKYGMVLTRRGAGSDTTTTQQINNGIFEGLTQADGAGLYIDYASNNVIVNGSSESNTNGLIITGNGGGMNTVIGLDMEANTTYDLILNAGGIGSANYNTFIGLYGTGSTFLTNVANRNVFMGGRLDKITLDKTTTYNTFQGVSIITKLTDHSIAGFENEWINSSHPGGLFRTHKFRGGTASNLTPPAYSTSITINAPDQDIVPIVATNGTAFTINAPNNPTRGQVLTFTIKNASGGALGVLTWNAVFKMGAAWTQPANGFSRSIEFYFNGTNWIEKGRTAVDIAN
jgi:hypothetical protein